MQSKGCGCRCHYFKGRGHENPQMIDETASMLLLQNRGLVGVPCIHASPGTDKMGSGAYGPSGSRAEPWPFVTPPRNAPGTSCHTSPGRPGWRLPSQ